MDWAALEKAVHVGMVDAAKDRELFAAALHSVYSEQDSIITFPLFGVVTRPEWEELGKARWNPPDWAVCELPWLSADEIKRWEGELETAEGPWDETFRQFLDTLARACVSARQDLGFPVLLLDDDEFGEELIRQVLPAPEVGELFPELEEHADELARLQALPTAERAVELAALLGAWEGPVQGEEAEALLRELGRDAREAVKPLLQREGKARWAAKILADLGDPDAVEALRAALPRLKASDQRWTASALSRLGRLDLVVEVPDDVRATAVAAPYRSFRDHAVSVLPLDYRQLEAVLPELEELLDKELRPGSGYCTITPDEVTAALAALDSEHVVVRRHAVLVLGEKRLSRPEIGPALTRVAEQDTDLDIRRLARLSLERLG